MRDLIDAAVQLRNVERALDQETSGIREDQLKDVTHCVESMDAYLKSLIDEFTMSYKPIADKQRIYEAEFKYRLEEEDRSADSTTVVRRAAEVPDNEAWTDILALPKLGEFRKSGLKHRDDEVEDRSTSVDNESSYARDFVGALDLASWILRSELLVLAGASVPQCRPHTKRRRRNSTACAIAAQREPLDRGPPRQVGSNTTKLGGPISGTRTNHVGFQ